MSYNYLETKNISDIDILSFNGYNPTSLKYSLLHIKYNLNISKRMPYEL